MDVSIVIVVSNMRMSKVLMDGDSSLNVLYVDTLEAMGIA